MRQPSSVNSGLILLGIVLLGSVLRFYGLDAKSLWFDEATSARFLDFTLPEVLERNADTLSLNPPFYFVILQFWTRIWGESDFALRSLSAVCGVLTIVGAYASIRGLQRLAPNNLGGMGLAPLLGGALVATSPLQIHLSQQVRGYTLGTAFLTWSSWLLFRALEAGADAPAFWIAYACLASCCCYSHNLATLCVATQFLFATLYIYRKRRSSPRTDGAASSTGTAADIPGGRSRDFWFLLAIAIFAVCYIIPWLPRLSAQSRNMSRSPYFYSLGERPTDVALAIFESVVATPLSRRTPDVIPNWTVVILLIIVLTYLAIRGSWPGRYMALAGLLPTVILVVFSFISRRSVFHTRYLSFIQLSWLSAIAIVVDCIPGRLQRRLLGVWLVLISLFLCSENWGILGPSAKPGIRAAITFIMEHRASGEPIVSLAPSTFYGAVHYTRGRIQPRLCVTKADRKLQRGAEQLKDEDLVTPEMLLSADLSGIWLIYSITPKFLVRFETPRSWEMSGKWEFEPDHPLEKPIYVEHYRITKDSENVSRG